MRFSLLLTTILAITMFLPAFAADTFHVAPGGADANPGTAKAPFATLERAQVAVRQKIAAGLKSDVAVVIHGGTYRFNQPWGFGPDDSGTAEHSVTYAAAPGEKVTISGGRPVTGWETEGEGVYSAKVEGLPPGGTFRHLYVNGRRARRARTPNKDAENPCLQLISAKLTEDLKHYSLRLDPALLGKWTNNGGLEIMVAGDWAINRLPIENVDTAKGVVTLKPPHAVGHQAIRPRAGRWCYFEGAPEMLDQPGEWVFDPKTAVLRYRPLPGEDMNLAEVIVPVVDERLVEIKGTREHPVRNLRFRGLAFEHTGGKLPEIGYMGIQACHHGQGDDWKRPWARVPAALCFDYAEGCSIEDGTLAHLGGCGVEMVSCCHDNSIEGNDIYDIGGNGIMIGGPRGEENVPKNNQIRNNHVHDCGVEYYGAVGIWVGFAQRTVVAHNLVHSLPYSGISVGWQWNPEPTACKENVVENNHVHDVLNRLCDGGCLYTLGLQPGTVIRGNHFHDAARSQFAQGAPNNGMFIDQGSKGYLFERNVIYDTAAEPVRFNRCEREWHTWRDNHFGKKEKVMESGKAIIESAGPEADYRGRFAP